MFHNCHAAVLLAPGSWLWRTLPRYSSAERCNGSCLIHRISRQGKLCHSLRWLFGTCSHLRKCKLSLQLLVESTYTVRKGSRDNKEPRIVPGMQPEPERSLSLAFVSTLFVLPHWSSNACGQCAKQLVWWQVCLPFDILPRKSATRSLQPRRSGGRSTLLSTTTRSRPLKATLS